MTTPTWVRIEPHTQTTDIESGLAAEVADPLWLLMRQWQLGELTGDDGGSPVAVDVGAGWSPITRYRSEGEVVNAGGTPAGEGVRIPQGVPIEALVEREPLLGRETSAWSARVRTGRSLRRRLVAAGLAEVARRLTEAYPFRAEVGADDVMSADERRYSAVLSGAVLDGVGVIGMRSADLPDAVTAGADTALLDEVLGAWERELAEDWGVLDDATGPSPAWVRDRLEYAFSVAAPPLPGDDHEIVLQAREYDGTGLSWHSVDLAPGATLGASADGGAQSRVFTTLPAQLSYPGMPASRFWELEDAAVTLGRATAGRTDLARMLVLDFALVFSPDWFLVPLELPVGSVARIDWVIVRDTFGVPTLVGTKDSQAQDLVGRHFQPATVDGEDGDNPLLVVLPSALSALASPAREEVSIQRDEGANLAWAIETSVLGPAGRGVPTGGSNAEFTLAEPGSTDHELTWRLATPVARSWTPLVSSAAADGQPDPRGRRLRRAKLVASPTAELRGARSQLMADVRDGIRDEEINRTGTQIRMVEQLARALDGSVHVWRGREKRAGRGEASSGLAYDSTTKRRPV